MSRVSRNRALPPPPGTQSGEILGLLYTGALMARCKCPGAGEVTTLMPIPHGFVSIHANGYVCVWKQMSHSGTLVPGTVQQLPHGLTTSAYCPNLQLLAVADATNKVPRARRGGGGWRVPCVRGWGRARRKSDGSGTKWNGNAPNVQRKRDVPVERGTAQWKCDKV